MNNFIEKIISLLSTISGMDKVYSPNLKEKTENSAAVQLLPSSNSTVNTLSNNLAYERVPFAVLVKGNSNDNDSLTLADSVFDKLHNTINTTYPGGIIINIEGSKPSFAYVNGKEQVIYNVNFEALVERTS